MNEVAFTVNPSSDFYKEYFSAKEEKIRFNNLAKSFFERNNFGKVKSYYQSEELGVKLNPEKRKDFSSQLKKNDDNNGLSLFKKSSVVHKTWIKEVVSKIDFVTLNCVEFWWMDFITQGSYNLWDNDGVIYGYLKDKLGDVKLADYMDEIKMSEYYSVIESLDK